MTDIFAWHYGPNGEAAIFRDSKDVPEGWLDHPFAEAAAAGASDGDGGGQASVRSPTSLLPNGGGAKGSVRRKRRRR